MDPHTHPSRHTATVEGIARVIRLDDGSAWLEPEQTSSCGSCAGAAACGASGPGEPGIGTVASRIEARRFRLDNPAGPQALCVGDRIVIGVSSRALIKASLVAFAIPLFFAIAFGGVAQGLYGSDVGTMLWMAIGLGTGLLVARIAAHYLSARGDLTPRFIRRARPGETCNTV